MVLCCDCGGHVVMGLGAFGCSCCLPVVVMHVYCHGGVDYLLNMISFL